jgi:hypothetical protein
MTDLKEYIKDLIYSVKNAFSSKDDKDDLDKIIEKEYENAFEILKKLGIIEHIEENYGTIKSNYKIKYIKPKLEILEDESSPTGEFEIWKNKIVISKKLIEEVVDEQLKSLSYKEIRESIGDIQYIEYSASSYNLKFLYPFYINERDIRKALKKALIRSIIFHEIWHSIDFNILYRPLRVFITLEGPTALDDFELRASAFEVVMYYLANGLDRDVRVHMVAYDNILMCRKYIEEMDKLEKDRIRVSYGLGFCYGNIIVAKYGSSLEENIYKIIDDIIHLDKEKAIDVIKLYGDNLEWLSNDKNSNVVV